MGWISGQWSPRVAFLIGGVVAVLAGVVAAAVRRSVGQLEPVPELVPTANAA
jgi:hypothetical protein